MASSCSTVIAASHGCTLLAGQASEAAAAERCSTSERSPELDLAQEEAIRSAQRCAHRLRWCQCRSKGAQPGPAPSRRYEKCSNASYDGSASMNQHLAHYSASRSALTIRSAAWPSHSSGHLRLRDGPASFSTDRTPVTIASRSLATN